MIKIFYKKDYEQAVEMLNLKDDEIKKLKENHEKEINNLKYENILNKSQDYDSKNDPDVLRAEMERLKANHKVELESWKIQVEDLKKEIKVIKKENKQLLKDKATALAEKTTKKKPGRKKKEVIE